MQTINYLEALESIMDGLRFGKYDLKFVNDFIDKQLKIIDTENLNNYYECVLALKFKGFTMNADDLAENVEIVRKYLKLEKLRDK